MIEELALVLINSDRAMHGLPPVKSRDNIPDSDGYVENAKAVLKAMREPSEKMIDRFVSRALCVSIHGEGGWSEYAVNQWQAMIDAALNCETVAPQPQTR